MDFLNQALTQLTDLFKSMTPGARIASALLLAVVVISLAYLFQAGVTGPDAYLMGGAHFSASELPAMEAAFAKAGLSAYSVDGTQVRVPRGQQSAYMAALADAGALPKDFGDYLMPAVTDSNPFLTGEQRRQMIKAAKQKELSEIIRNMPGIEKAAVMYDVESKSGLRREKVYTASVMVKPAGSLPLDESRVPMIRHLVAGAVAGLNPNSVTVVDQNGRAYSAHSSLPGMAAGDDAYFERQRRWQQWVEESVRQSLTYVPEVTVTASVELDKEIEHVVRTTKPDDPQKAVPIVVRDETKTSTEERGGPAGRPGLEAQGPNQAAALAGGSNAGNKSSLESTNNETQNVVGQSEQKIAMHPLTPKKISVAVGIPDSYFKQIWHQQNPTPAGQEKPEPESAALDKIVETVTAQIRTHVARVVLSPEKEDLAETEMNVTVTKFAHLQKDELPGPSVATTALGWFGDNYQPLGLAGLAVVSLLMIRSMVRSLPAAPAPAVAEGTIAMNQTFSAGGENSDAGAAAAGRLKRRTDNGPSLQEELTEIIREDPDAAAKILKSWIGKAG